jgi:hypothetical protein
MDDRQPEKWMLIANQSTVQMEDQEPNGLRRMAVMEEINTVLERIKTSREDLMNVATGRRSISEFDSTLSASRLHATVARFAAALMIEPVIEAELYGVYSNIMPDAHRVITSSRTIFNMRTGFLGIPRHLTAEFAADEERLRKERTLVLKSKRNREPEDMLFR